MTSAVSTSTSVAYGRFHHLIIIFCSWKVLLLALAAFCPGPGYDTSALVMLDSSINRHRSFTDLPRIRRLGINLFRWDALYFVDAAERGYVHEQQWAFSWAYSRLLRVLGQFFPGTAESPLQCYIVAGIILSNVCHLLSVLVLYRLLILVLGTRQQRHVAFVASVLHILTPASLFMSAPYAEALFSLLNMTGMLCYVHSKRTAQCGYTTVQEDVYKLSSGALFASATLIRSNGLLSGLILLCDAIGYLSCIFSWRLDYSDVRRLLVTSLAGLFVACGFAGPQYVAYQQFCGASNLDRRLWCDRNIPSIYSWVQSHYWNVGLFRYWTVSNLPLFLLAAPILWLLLTSSTTALHTGIQELRNRSHSVARQRPTLMAFSLPEIALPQFVLAVTALTNFHVQIVNRIASGYPTWYLTTAQSLVDSHHISSIPGPPLKVEWVVRGIIMYALVQGILYANFLPPA